MFGARCGLLSPWYVSSTTHRLSFFYMRTGTYNVLTVAVPCASFLNCDAKVQTYLLSTKQKTKNLCLFNVLQQIRLFLPKFIHILSTKTTKCAYIGANLCLYGVITHVHYIKTNNKLYLQPFACVRGMLHPIFNHHYKLRDLSFSCSCVLCRVSYAVADTWMYCYVSFVLVCVPCVFVCVEVWHILFVLVLSLFSA